MLRRGNSPLHQLQPAMGTRIDPLDRLIRTCAGLWLFREGKGGKVYDAIPAGNHGTWNGIGSHWAAGRFGWAGAFNGSNDYVDLGDCNYINGATALSGAAWIKVEDLNADNTILGKDEFIITSQFLWWRDETGSGSGLGRNNTITIICSDADTEARLTGSDGALNDTDWHHVAFTFLANHSSGLRLYIDGVEDAESPVTTIGVSALKSNTNTLRIGAPYPTVAGKYFNGRISYVGIWHSVRTVVEIQQLYLFGARAGFHTRRVFPSGAAGEITLDKWAQSISEPIAAPFPVQHAGAFHVNSLVDWPTQLDQWQQPTNQPTLPAPVADPAGATQLLNPADWPSEQVTLDKWSQPASQPIMTPFPVQLAGAFQVNSLVDWPTQLDEWQQPTSQPTLPAPIADPAGLTQLLNPADWAAEDVTLDKWAQPAGQPILPPFPVQLAGAFQISSLVDWPTQLDQWQQPTNQPTLPAPIADPAGSFHVLNPADWATEEITFDKWAQPASQPIRVPPVFPESRYSEPPSPAAWVIAGTDAQRADSIRIKIGGVEIRHLEIVGAIPGIVILAVAAKNGPGVGRIRGNGSLVAWQAPDSSTWGPWVNCGSDGAYLLEDGDDPDKWLRVQAYSSYFQVSPAEERIFLNDLFANGPGHDDVTASEAQYGAIETYLLDLHNESTVNLADVRVWLDVVTYYLEISADGASWSSPTDESAGLAFGELAAGSSRRLHLRRTIAAGSDPDPKVLSRIHYAFSAV